MRTLTILLALSLAACGGKSKPAPAPVDETGGGTDEPVDETGGDAMMTPDECEADGATVVGDIGDGSVHCEAGFDEVGHVSGGVEASLCCKPQPDFSE